VYHLTEESHPHSVNIDYIGICCMALASVDVNERFVKNGNFLFILVTQFTLTVAFFSVNIIRKTDHPRSQLLVIALAAVGNFPAAAVILDPSRPPVQRCLFALSPALFVFGLVVVKSRHHIAWHWTASIAQAVLVVAVLE
jgi:hypothetical protein